MSEIPYAYKGEVQLLRWSETPKGRTVTLLLDPFVGEQHPFKAMKCGENGSRMQIAAVLVDDQDQPAEPPTKKSPGSSNGRTPDFDSGNGGSSPSPGSKERPPFDKLPRSQQAALKCRDAEFQRWLRDTNPTMATQCYGETEEDAANQLLKWKLGITSRRQLDEPGSVLALNFDRLMTDYSVRGMVR